MAARRQLKSCSVQVDADGFQGSPPSIITERENSLNHILSPMVAVMALAAPSIVSGYIPSGSSFFLRPFLAGVAGASAGVESSPAATSSSSEASAVAFGKVHHIINIFFIRVVGGTAEQMHPHQVEGAYGVPGGGVGVVV